MSNAKQVAIDLAEQAFHVSGMYDADEVVERKRLRRAGLQSYLTQLLKRCTVATEAYGTSTTGAGWPCATSAGC